MYVPSKRQEALWVQSWSQNIYTLTIPLTSIIGGLSRARHGTEPFTWIVSVLPTTQWDRQEPAGWWDLLLLSLHALPSPTSSSEKRAASQSPQTPAPIASSGLKKSWVSLEQALALRNRCASYPANNLRTECAHYNISDSSKLSFKGHHVLPKGGPFCALFHTTWNILVLAILLMWQGGGTGGMGKLI